MTKPRLTPEDIELFRQSVKGVKPLEQKAIEHARLVRKKRRVPASNQTNANDIGSGPPGYIPTSIDISDQNFIEFRRPGLQDRLFQKLRRGELPITAELDLHGMTSDRAQLALDRFMERLQSHGRQQCVRIIHGKGYGSRDKVPVIKRHTQVWLQCNINVLAYCSCRPEDGGTGAVYVLVKNSK